MATVNISGSTDENKSPTSYNESLNSTIRQAYLDALLERGFDLSVKKRRVPMEVGKSASDIGRKISEDMTPEEAGIYNKTKHTPDVGVSDNISSITSTPVKIEVIDLTMEDDYPQIRKTIKRDLVEKESDSVSATKKSVESILKEYNPNMVRLTKDRTKMSPEEIEKRRRNNEASRRSRAKAKILILKGKKLNKEI